MTPVLTSVRDRTKKSVFSTFSARSNALSLDFTGRIFPGQLLPAISRGDPNQQFLPIINICADHPAVVPGPLPAITSRQPPLTVCSRPCVDRTALPTPPAALDLPGMAANNHEIDCCERRTLFLGGSKGARFSHRAFQRAAIGSQPPGAHARDGAPYLIGIHRLHIALCARKNRSLKLCRNGV